MHAAESAPDTQYHILKIWGTKFVCIFIIQIFTHKKNTKEDWMPNENYANI